MSSESPTSASDIASARRGEVSADPSLLGCTVILARSIPGESKSMDVVAEALVRGLRSACPSLRVKVITPPRSLANASVLSKVMKYAFKYFVYPILLLSKRGDIYHIVDHSYAHLAYILRLTGRPVVITCHDLVNFDQDVPLQSMLSSILSLRVWHWTVRGLKRASHVVAVSGRSAQDVVRHLRVPTERVTVVHNGIDGVFRPLPPEKAVAFRRHHSVGETEYCLLHVGGSRPRKNVITVLRALRHLREQGHPFRFWKVGKDLSPEQAAYVREHHLEDSVTYLGSLSEQDLVLAYNAADVFVFPSLLEGFGLPVLEAMACGTPVITSNTSSLPEVAGDAAILVEPTDEEAIAEAAIRLCTETGFRAAQVQRGLQRAHCFTWGRAARRVADVYASVWAV